eukprot:TRINITY_DN2084_c0_g1_i1.p2 TRINITY_DN2084_c0_g1~~TRINITY_DN2084_c0_g1_i1.p2  ORF type:complete len:166 (-),score=26.86 TRINITY_DN2084_c0_g1_i1:52-549(-)
MVKKIIIKKSAYHDSVTLMAISGKITALDGVADAVVAMATDLNKDLLQGIDMLTDEVAALGPDDLVIAIKAKDEETCESAVVMVEESLSKRASGKKSAGVPAPVTIKSAVKLLPEAKLAVISVPGEYAAREAMQALKAGLHVMMFSDNVSIEEKKKKKKKKKNQN